jgi:uncharacterized membrane protein YvlD (DUF360 family)
MPIKKLLKKFCIFLLVLVVLWQYLPTVVLTGEFEVLLIASAVLVLLDHFIKPILKTIMIPVNAITFGLLSWVSAVIVFYLTVRFVTGLEVVDYTVPQIYTDYYVFPPTPITGVWSYVVSGLCVVILAKVITWIFKKKNVVK